MLHTKFRQNRSTGSEDFEGFLAYLWEGGMEVYKGHLTKMATIPIYVKKNL